MSKFDIDKYNSRECEVHNHGFYLGAQSKQAEIDELHKVNINLLRTKQNALREIDELRNQLDKIKELNNERK